MSEEEELRDQINVLKAEVERLRNIPDADHKIVHDDGRQWFASHDPIPWKNRTKHDNAKAVEEFGSPTHFGPFDTLGEILEWARRQQDEHHGVVFLQLVDPESDPVTWYDDQPKEKNEEATDH